jgi:hypothetical protein
VVQSLEALADQTILLCMPIAKQITNCTIRSHMPRSLDSFKLYICTERTASPRGRQIREGAKSANSWKRHVKSAYEPIGKARCHPPALFLPWLTEGFCGKILRQMFPQFEVRQRLVRSSGKPLAGGIRICPSPHLCINSVILTCRIYGNPALPSVIWCIG